MGASSMPTSPASTSAAMAFVSTAISPKGVVKPEDEGVAMLRTGTKCGGPINSTRSKALSGAATTAKALAATGPEYM
jgi:hypothetical protein